MGPFFKPLDAYCAAWAHHHSSTVATIELNGPMCLQAAWCRLHWLGPCVPKKYNAGYIEWAVVFQAIGCLVRRIGPSLLLNCGRDWIEWAQHRFLMVVTIKYNGTTICCCLGRSHFEKFVIQWVSVIFYTDHCSDDDTISSDVAKRLEPTRTMGLECIPFKGCIKLVIESMSCICINRQHNFICT